MQHPTRRLAVCGLLAIGVFLAGWVVCLLSRPGADSPRTHWLSGAQRERLRKWRHDTASAEQGPHLYIKVAKEPPGSSKKYAVRVMGVITFIQESRRVGVKPGESQVIAIPIGSVDRVHVYGIELSSGRRAEFVIDRVGSSGNRFMIGRGLDLRVVPRTHFDAWMSK